MRKNRNFKRFEDWHPIDIDRKLGYKRTDPSPALKDWITVQGSPPDSLKPLLDELRRDLIFLGSERNEAELVLDFINPLLRTVHFRGENYNYFSERTLAAEINGFHVSGIVDWMAATGLIEPESPYFFLHEYKKTKGTEADPLGQLLIALISAQKLNANERPLYGAYVVGRAWSFVLLEGTTFSESQAYDATDPEELFHIWLILNKTKILLEAKAEIDQ